MIDQRIVEQIIESNDIVAIVEQYLPLKKTGANFRACCPFHEEKTASFTVSDKKQMYKCFGCGKGGNVINFVKEMEKISYFEAMEKLAGRAGIKLSKPDKKETEQQSKTKLMVNVYELAKDYYCKNLLKFGDNALLYLSERGISGEIIKRFDIGYALNSNNGLFNYLLKNNINKDIMVESGLISKTQSSHFDLFRDRVIFPIHSSTGKVVAFGARALPGNNYGGKYINSPTTPIYTKGNELYGFFLTRNEVSKKNGVLVTEGYLDFIRLYEAGFTNSVASLGTALTEKQIQLVSRYSNNFYLLYDGDSAGRKAALEAAKRILIAGSNPLIVELPADADADSYLRENGPDKLAKLIAEAKSINRYIHDDEGMGLAKKDKIELMIEIIAAIPDKLSAELLQKQTSEIFGVSLRAITGRSRPVNRSIKQPIDKNRATPDNQYLEEKLYLIHLLNGSITEYTADKEITPDFFFIEDYKKIFELFAGKGYSIGSSVVMSVLAGLEDKDPVLTNIITELSMAEEPNASVEAVINDLKLRKLKYELNSNTSTAGFDRGKTIVMIEELEKRNTEIKRLSTRVVKNIF